MSAAKVILGATVFVVLDQMLLTWLHFAHPLWLHASAASLRPGPWWAWQIAALVILLAFRPQTWPWALLLGGWASNIITHVRFGAYLDYLPLGRIYTNAADLGITLGTAALLLVALNRVRRP